MPVYKLGFSESSRCLSIFTGSRFAIWSGSNLTLLYVLYASRMEVQFTIRAVGIVKLVSLVKSHKVPTFPGAAKEARFAVPWNRVYLLASIDSGVRKKRMEMWSCSSVDLKFASSRPSSAQSRYPHLFLASGGSSFISIQASYLSDWRYGVASSILPRPVGEIVLWCRSKRR